MPGRILIVDDGKPCSSACATTSGLWATRRIAQQVIAD